MNGGVSGGIGGGLRGSFTGQRMSAASGRHSHADAHKRAGRESLSLTHPLQPTPQHQQSQQQPQSADSAGKGTGLAATGAGDKVGQWNDAAYALTRELHALAKQFGLQLDTPDTTDGLLSARSAKDGTTGTATGAAGRLSEDGRRRAEAALRAALKTPGLFEWDRLMLGAEPGTNVRATGTNDTAGALKAHTAKHQPASALLAKEVRLLRQIINGGGDDTESNQTNTEKDHPAAQGTHVTHTNMSDPLSTSIAMETQHTTGQGGKIGKSGVQGPHGTVKTARHVTPLVLGSQFEQVEKSGSLVEFESEELRSTRWIIAQLQELRGVSQTLWNAEHMLTPLRQKQRHTLGAAKLLVTS